MKKWKYILVAIALSFLLGCPQPGNVDDDGGTGTEEDGSDDGTGDGGDDAPVVYLAGRMDLESGAEVAVQWSGGSRDDLKTGEDYAEGYDIFVSGGRVYTAGYYENSSGDYVAVLWEDGSGTDLAGGSGDDASAQAVFVDSSGAVYVGGYKPDPQLGTVAGYWKDGTWTTLPTDSNSTYNIKVHDIIVSQDTVYAGGHDYTGGNGYWIPVVWNDGTKEPQDMAFAYEDGVVYDVAVGGSDVYAAGRVWDEDIGTFGEYHAVYWKNGSDTMLHDTSYAYAYGIDVYNGDVYVVGEYENMGGDDVAVVWKNGTPTDLAVNGAAYDIEITSGGDVYAAGYVYEDSTYKTVYWKNGTRVDVDSNDTFANAVFVEE